MDGFAADSKSEEVSYSRQNGSTVEPLYSGHHSMGNEILAYIEGWPYIRG